MDFVDASGRLHRYDASISRCVKQEMEELGPLYLNVVQKPLFGLYAGIKTRYRENIPMLNGTISGTKNDQSILAS